MGCTPPPIVAIKDTEQAEPRLLLCPCRLPVSRGRARVRAAAIVGCAICKVCCSVVSSVCLLEVGSSSAAWLDTRFDRSTCCQAACMPIHGEPMAAAGGLGGPVHVGSHQHNILQDEWLLQASANHAVTQKHDIAAGMVCKAATSSGDKSR